MFKIYGVSDEKNTSNSMETRSLDTDVSKDMIDVNIHEERDHDTDIGQIAVDILDLSDAIVIIAPIAGVDPSDIDIGLSRNILTLSGERKEPTVYGDAKRLLVEECFYGAFSRSIILPENLWFDEIEATVDNNVIIIRIPKLTLISKVVKVQK